MADETIPPRQSADQIVPPPKQKGPEAAKGSAPAAPDLKAKLEPGGEGEVRLYPSSKEASDVPVAPKDKTIPK